MSYATRYDLKKMLEMALLENKFHIAITVMENDEMICNCYGQGIETETVIELLKGKKE